MSNVRLTPDVDDILRRSTVNGNLLILPGQLDRKAYEAVNKVIVNAGGKWNRAKKGHVFAGDPMAKLGVALDTGVSVDEKQLYQAFFTPPEVADYVAATADVFQRCVLEPSAGDGALVRACLEQGCECVHAVEIHPDHAERIGERTALQITVADFFQLHPQAIYERVVMNPPFTKGQDRRHVEHALKFVKPGGRLVSIVPASSFWLDGPPAFVGKHEYDVELLPEGAFKASGTGVRTAMITVEVAA